MAALDDFRQTYLRLCKDNNVESQDCIIEQIKVGHQSSGGLYQLDLSTRSLSVKSCKILGKVFATDRAFSVLKFNDCMLPEEGINAIMHGLSSNVSVKKVEFKGNNIKGSSVEQLGRLLRDNSSILSLCLEWNGVGVLDNSFAVFCEGLTNSKLQLLDLRNNQISHSGIEELAKALKHNVKLRAIDLRWNSAGLIGARALLNALMQNKTLIKLELAGNNVPNDILHSIKSAIENNADRNKLLDDHGERQRILSQKIQSMEKDRRTELTGLLHRLDAQEASLRHSSRSSQERIGQLQNALSERKSQFNNLTSKLSLVETELAMSESKVTELSSLLTKSHEASGDFVRRHADEMKREKEDRAIQESKFHREINELTEKNGDLDIRNNELEMKVHNQADLITSLREQLIHAQAETKMKATECDEKVKLEKQKTKDAYRDADDIKAKEIDRVRREMQELEKGYKDRISRMENHRLELEEQISHFKNAQVSERLNFEEQLLVSKQRIKQEEDQRTKQLEEKIRLIQGSKDELQAHSMMQSSTISDLQTKNASLSLETEGLKHKIETLNSEITGKNNEMMTEVSRVQNEMSQRIQKLEKERQSQQELYDKIDSLTRKLQELEVTHNKIKGELNLEVAKLKEAIKQKDHEINHMRSDEAQRVSMLQSAIQNYVVKAPYNTSTA